MLRWLIRLVGCGVLIALGVPVTLAAEAQPLVFELRVVDGQLVGQQRTLRVNQGDTLELNWRSDQPLRLHLHGYDIELRLQPNVAGQMRVDAYANGRYPVSVHQPLGEHGAALLHLEVMPH